MATTLSLTQTYAGIMAGQILRTAQLANESLKYVTVKQNVPYKLKVRKLVDDITPAALTCDFTPTGTVTLTERVLTLEGFQVHRNICKNDFLTDWSAKDAQDGKLNSEISAALIANMMEGLGAANERIMWQGVNATVGEYDGFITLIDADNTVNFVSGPETLTVANIIAKIELLLAEVPTAVENSNEKPLLYMNKKTFHLYRQANVATANGWYTYNGPAVTPTFMGIYDIAIAPGMPDNTMIVAQKSNLWWGTNLESDMNQVDMLDMYDKDLSQNVRFAVRYFAGAQYGIGSEIAAYGPGLS